MSRSLARFLMRESPGRLFAEDAAYIDSILNSSYVNRSNLEEGVRLRSETKFREMEAKIYSLEALLEAERSKSRLESRSTMLDASAEVCDSTLANLKEKPKSRHWDDDNGETNTSLFDHDIMKEVETPAVYGGDSNFVEIETERIEDVLSKFQSNVEATIDEVFAGKFLDTSADLITKIYGYKDVDKEENIFLDNKRDYNSYTSNGSKAEPHLDTTAASTTEVSTTYYDEDMSRIGHHNISLDIDGYDYNDPDYRKLRNGIDKFHNEMNDLIKSYSSKGKHSGVQGQGEGEGEGDGQIDDYDAGKVVKHIHHHHHHYGKHPPLEGELDDSFDIGRVDMHYARDDDYIEDEEELYEEDMERSRTEAPDDFFLGRSEGHFSPAHPRHQSAAGGSTFSVDESIEFTKEGQEINRVLGKYMNSNHGVFPGHKKQQHQQRGGSTPSKSSPTRRGSGHNVSTSGTKKSVPHYMQSTTASMASGASLAQKEDVHKAIEKEELARAFHHQDIDNQVHGHYQHHAPAVHYATSHTGVLPHRVTHSSPDASASRSRTRSGSGSIDGRSVGSSRNTSSPKKVPSYMQATRSSATSATKGKPPLSSPSTRSRCNSADSHRSAQSSLGKHKPLHAPEQKDNEGIAMPPAYPAHTHKDVHHEEKTEIKEGSATTSTFAENELPTAATNTTLTSAEGEAAGTKEGSATTSTFAENELPTAAKNTTLTSAEGEAAGTKEGSATTSTFAENELPTAATNTTLTSAQGEAMGTIAAETDEVRAANSTGSQKEVIQPSGSTQEEADDTKNMEGARGDEGEKSENEEVITLVSISSSNTAHTIEFSKNVDDQLTRDQTNEHPHHEHGNIGHHDYGYLGSTVAMNLKKVDERTALRVKHTIEEEELWRARHHEEQLRLQSLDPGEAVPTPLFVPAPQPPNPEPSKAKKKVVKKIVKKKSTKKSASNQASNAASNEEYLGLIQKRLY